MEFRKTLGFEDLTSSLTVPTKDQSVFKDARNVILINNRNNVQLHDGLNSFFLEVHVTRSGKKMTLKPRWVHYSNYRALKRGDQVIFRPPVGVNQQWSLEIQRHNSEVGNWVEMSLPNHDFQFNVDA